MKYDHIKKAFSEYLDSMTVQELRKELESKYGFEFSKSSLKLSYQSGDWKRSKKDCLSKISFSFKERIEMTKTKFSIIETEKSSIPTSDNTGPKAA